MKNQNNMMNFLIKSLLLAALYIASGYLGLSLAVPPGYSTFIWPPSGIALGFLLIYGWRLWPSILLGSFLLNTYLSIDFVSGQGLICTKILAAFLIATGSSVQALAGYELIKRYIARYPAHIIYSIFKIFFMITPLVCLIAASISHLALYVLGLIALPNIPLSWFIWWMGDAIGIFIFLPIMLISPLNHKGVLLRNKSLIPLPIIAMLLLLATIGISLYAWKITTAIAFKNVISYSYPYTILLLGILISALLAIYLLLNHIKHLREKKWIVAVTNKKIRESEERYNLVVKGMSAGLWDWNIAENTMYWSYLLKEMFGIKDLSFKPNLEYFAIHLHPEDRDRTLKMLYEHLDKHTPYNIEYRLKLPNNEYHWFHSSGQAQWNGQGKAMRMAGSVIDINNRVLTTQALHESISLRKAILAGARHMIITTDTKGIVTLFNRAAEVALGYSRDEVIGKLTPVIWHDLTELHHKAKRLSQELKITVKPDFDVLVKKAQIWGSDEGEWHFVRKDGSHFLVQMTVSLLKHNDNISGYIGIIEDITDRKKAEKALKRNEETFRSAIESASIGMALVGTDGHWLMVNKALCEMLGYSEAEFLKLDFQTITYVDDLPADEELLHQMLIKKIKTYQIEKRYIHKNGKIIWAELSVALMLDEKNHPSYFISQIQDITESKETERIKSELSSIINHELRTPLTSIRGSLGLITGSLSNDLPPKVNHLIKIAYKNSDRLILLINDMLDIDKIASGKMQFNLQEQSLSKLIDQAIETNQPFADKYGVLLIKGNIDNSVIIKVDPERFLQVIANLLSNAAKFSDISNEVTIYSEIIKDKVRIIVRDHGIGIPEEFYDRIFDKFSQADSSITRSQQGTGLGLYISKELIQKMQGSIHFESQLGKGSSFYVELPIAVHTAPLCEDSHLHEMRYLKVSKEKFHILHIEEDADLSNMLATALQPHAKIIHANTLKKAKKLMTQYPFKIIILDLVMPDGFGFDIIHSLSSEELSTTRIVILSSHEPSDLIRDHVDAVIIKSRIHENDMVNIILNLLYENSKKGTDND